MPKTQEKTGRRKTRGRRPGFPPANRSSPSSPSIRARRASAKSPAPSASPGRHASRLRPCSRNSPAKAWSSAQESPQAPRRPAVGDGAGSHRPRPRRRTPRPPGRMAEAESGAPPAIVIPPAREKRGPAAGIGDRVLARLTPAEGEDAAYKARVIKVLDQQPATVLGVVRDLPGGKRIEPVDRKQNELILDADATGKAKDGDLVAVTLVGTGRFGPDRARVAEVIGSMKSEKAVCLIAIHAHGIPHVFPPRGAGRGRGGQAGDARPSRGLARPAAGHHRPGRRQGPRRRRACRAGQRPEEPRRPHRHRRHRRRRLVRAARQRPRPRGAEARQLGLFPRPGRADAARAHLQRPLLAARERGPAGHCRAHGLLRRRPQAQPPLPSRDDALGRQALLRAGAGRLRRRARRHLRAAGRRTGFAMGRLCLPQARPRRARAA